MSGKKKKKLNKQINTSGWLQVSVEVIVVEEVVAVVMVVVVQVETVVQVVVEV